MPDVALWVAFQYACVAFSQRMQPELDFTDAGYQRVVEAFKKDVIPERLPTPWYSLVSPGETHTRLAGRLSAIRNNGAFIFCEFQ